MTYRLLLHISFFVLSMAISHPVFSRTWYIKQDGTGDAATIQAGVDSAGAGDTILVGPGSYYLEQTIHMKDNLVLTSEKGPMETFIHPFDFFDVYTALSPGDDGVISGFWIKPFFLYGICMVRNRNVYLENNIIESVSISEGIHVDDSSVFIRNNLTIGAGVGVWIVAPYDKIYVLSNNIFMNIVYCHLSSIVLAECNDVLLPSDCTSTWDAYNNFSLDPEFCGQEGSGNYYLQSDSPCAPGNHANACDCGLIGPLPVGCGSVEIEHKTWGHIKAMYRD